MKHATATVRLPKSQRLTQSVRRKGNRPAAVSAKRSVAPLSTSEKEELAKHEETVRHHLETFSEAGMALIEIRDGRLYRESHSTFEDYCRAKWEFSKTQANRLIAAAKVTENVSKVGLVPESESQVRVLTLLSPAFQRKVWTIAAKQAKETDSRVTAKLVSAVAHKVAPKAFKTASRARKPGASEEESARYTGEQVLAQFNKWAVTNTKLILGSSGPEVVKLVQGFLSAL